MDILPACVAGLAALAFITYVIGRTTSPKLDPREPPVLKPRMPFIGHIVGLFKHEAAYFRIIRERTSNPVVTLPMLNQKNYFIFSPFLTQQAMRSRYMDFDLVGLAFAKRVADLSAQAMSERVKKGPGTYSTETVAAIKSSLTGEGLYRMNDAMLSCVGSQLNLIGSGKNGLDVPGLWPWIRDMMTMATVEAFYGHANPFRDDPAALNALWSFDDALSSMLFLPPWMTGAGPRHRDQIASALRPYFDARLDKNADVSAFVASRTEISYKHGIVGDDLCRNEVINIWVATANSIPALFWTLIYIWQRADVIEELRREILPLVNFAQDSGKRKATLDIRLVEKKCPTLISCQREGIRVANHMVARRTVTEDTVLTDEDGTAYLLKKGNDIMWSAMVSHEMTDVWGSDAASFDPERFKRAVDKDVEKKRRAAYMPFGGGLHLCPGRNFAFAEILGLISTLVLGYEIKGLRLDKIKMGGRALASAIPKPTDDGDGGPVTLKKRPGWEDVDWSYSC